MNTYKIIFLVFISLALASCEKIDINENPNKVSQTHPDLLLTQIASRAFQVQGRGAMYASRMIVQTDGESSEQYYKWGRGSFDGFNQLRQVTKMIEEATRIENNSYVGVGHFFRAYYFYNMALSFGSIPYADALKGETDQLYQPAYSSQKEVFVGVLKELEQANSLLAGNDFISGDPIFNGDVSKWRKLVNSFRLKILLSLSKKEADTDLQVKSSFAAIYASEPIISSFDESARLDFADVVDTRYTEFNSSSYGSGLYMSSTFIDQLKERQDPRLFIYADRTKQAKENGLAVNDFNAYEGGNPTDPYNDVNLLAAAGKVSKVNARYTVDPTTEAHNLLSYSEVQFILAEAAVRGWIATDAKTHYENAVKANFKFYNTYAKGNRVDAVGQQGFVTEAAANTYLSGAKVLFTNAVTADEKLSLILTQKYFTSFLQTGWRMYFDHLRTGYPAFSYLGTNTPPTRWIYPSSEYNDNSENVSQAIKEQFGAANDEIRQKTWWLN
ncbi:hypothetical protein GCM10011416_17490 [Polaribacter pacificus]|uniref:Starch-binding associating with outer membrane n=1 Tax=Polaribacter pacificus TaxID=1775173 RepID=A0A917HZH2_9FLAO|nr:SusD/RagB family nutrient-binding outer membrane lipoprotein [Polaribacter pacificus]GGG99618.1 hypothetical protein GCM10011416_17490 [Polaribacter pacificus]